MTSNTPHSGLLKIRTWQRDQSAAVVQATQREIQHLVYRIEELTKSILQWSQERRKLQSGVVKLQQWRENEAYRNELIQQKSKTLCELELLDQRLQQERQVLLEHEKELKQVQKMIEHSDRIETTKRLKLEQSELDTWAGLQARISETTRP